MPSYIECELDGSAAGRAATVVVAKRPGDGAGQGIGPSSGSAIAGSIVISNKGYRTAKGSRKDRPRWQQDSAIAGDLETATRGESPTISCCGGTVANQRSGRIGEVADVGAGNRAA